MDTTTILNTNSTRTLVNGTASNNGDNRNGNQTRSFGVSGPLTLSPPKPEDYEQTRKLEECLRSFDLFETKEEMAKRINVLSQVNGLVKEFVQKVSEQKKMPPEDISKLNGKVFTFGSFRLGVHTRGADIDTLLVVPRHLERTDFFTSFVEILKEQPNVEYVRSVEEAFVPVVKTKIDNIELDILFARLALKNIPPDQDLKNIGLLKNLEPKCVRSLNGCRVTDDILSLVPNHESFKLALRAVKFWAKKRCIYSNAMGYLGGVSWAMLVARTCQLYPNALASVILQKFFFVFRKWNWPKPVLLRDNKDDYENLGFPVWDPRVNMPDRFHLMPIITPSYPQQNSTFNVTSSTRNIILQEFQEAEDICIEINNGNLEWKDLFKPLNFFAKYTHFIIIISSCQAEWTSLLESKIRLLVQTLERQPSIKLVHLNPISFENVLNDSKKTMWFIGLDFDEKMKCLNLDLTTDIVNFVAQVKNTASNNLHLSTDDMFIDIKYVKRKDLNQYLSEDDLKKIKKEKTVKEKNKNKKKNDENTISSKRAKIDNCEASNNKTEPSTSTESNNLKNNDETVEIKTTKLTEDEQSIPFLGGSIDEPVSSQTG